MSGRRFIAAAAAPFTAGWFRLRPGIRILMYHRVRPVDAYDQLSVSPLRFRAQMRRLKSGRAPVLSLEAALAKLDHGGGSGVVVTFDDGYRDNLEHAWPVLEELEIPATIFVTSDFADQATTHPRYSGEPGRVHLDWSELCGLAQSELITIGSHSVSHPHLPRLNDDRAALEISESRTRIEQMLGRTVAYFCYPSGDFGTREKRLARAAGYWAAVSVAPGVNRAGSERLALNRTEITDRDDAFMFAAKLAGAMDLPHRLLHRRRQAAFAKGEKG